MGIKKNGTIKYGPDWRILVLSFSGMGDMLLFTPALHRLRESLPRAYIKIMVKSEGSAQVLKGNPDLDELEVFDPKSAGIHQNFSFYLRNHKAKYDLSISTFPALTALNNLSTWVIGARHRWTYDPLKVSSLAFLQNHTIPYYHGSHRVIYNLRLVESVIKALKGDDLVQEAIPIPNQIDKLNNIKLFYFVSEGERRFATQFLDNLLSDYNLNGLKNKASTGDGPLIGIHPGSASDQPFKRWPENKFASLASRLQSTLGASIALFGDQQELPLAQGIASQMKIPPLILTGRLTLRETAAIMERCRLFISNDSGLMHLAVTLGVMVLGIFGPTDETNTAPIGKGNTIAILSNLDCKPPCRKRFLFKKYCPYGYKCLDKLETEQVLELLPPLG